MSDRPALSEATCKRFAALALLDRMAHAPGAFHAALLEGDNTFLEPVFDFMLAEDLVSIGDDDHYRATPLGRRAYQRLLHQQQSYLAHFDIFAGVDLGEGTFAEPEADYLDDPRWSDLRVAAAELKGVDPYRIVFLSMLASGQFFENPGWKFDVALGSSFFSELEAIVREQIAMEELGYQDEDGTLITGEDVLQDVILQGAAINQQRLAEERNRQPSLLNEEEGPAEGEEENLSAFDVALVPYEPFGPAAAYAGSATFVEPLWLDPYW
ncbi:MAG TPA: hypothetical protein VKB51_19505 [bacterium]|nr:hypothetical protein [bacterium]